MPTQHTLSPETKATCPTTNGEMKTSEMNKSGRESNNNGDLKNENSMENGIGSPEKPVEKARKRESETCSPVPSKKAKTSQSGEPGCPFLCIVSGAQEKQQQQYVILPNNTKLSEVVRKGLAYLLPNEDAEGAKGFVQIGSCKEIPLSSLSDNEDDTIDQLFGSTNSNLKLHIILKSTPRWIVEDTRDELFKMVENHVPKLLVDSLECPMELETMKDLLKRDDVQMSQETAISFRDWRQVVKNKFPLTKDVSSTPPATLANVNGNSHKAAHEDLIQENGACQDKDERLQSTEKHTRSESPNCPIDNSTVEKKETNSSVEKKETDSPVAKRETDSPVAKRDTDSPVKKSVHNNFAEKLATYSFVEKPAYNNSAEKRPCSRSDEECTPSLPRKKLGTSRRTSWEDSDKELLNGWFYNGIYPAPKHDPRRPNTAQLVVYQEIINKGRKQHGQPPVEVLAISNWFKNERAAKKVPERSCNNSIRPASSEQLPDSPEPQEVHKHSIPELPNKNAIYQLDPTVRRVREETDDVITTDVRLGTASIKREVEEEKPQDLSLHDRVPSTDSSSSSEKSLARGYNTPPLMPNHFLGYPHGLGSAGLPHFSYQQQQQGPTMPPSFLPPSLLHQYGISMGGYSNSQWAAAAAFAQSQAQTRGLYSSALDSPHITVNKASSHNMSHTPRSVSSNGNNGASHMNITPAPAAHQMSMMPMNEGGGEDRKKRSRVFIDPLSEIPKLEEWYATETHPSSYTIEVYTSNLNNASYRQRFPKLEPKNVQLWFKNHRAKVKRKKNEDDSMGQLNHHAAQMNNGQVDPQMQAQMQARIEAQMQAQVDPQMQAQVGARMQALNSTTQSPSSSSSSE